MIPQWLGSVSYREAVDIQRRFHAEVRAGGPDVVLGLEHPAVVTLGLRGNRGQDVAAWADLEVVQTDRGGQATLHSPGQLVIYPIIDLRRRDVGPRQFVRTLLENTVALLKDFDIDGEAREDSAGVYTELGKLAFCGLRIEQGVSRHGLSLNVKNDLSLFRAIRPCGRSEERLASWENFRSPRPLPDLFTRWVDGLKGRL